VNHQETMYHANEKHQEVIPIQLCVFAKEWAISMLSPKERVKILSTKPNFRTSLYPCHSPTIASLKYTQPGLDTTLPIRLLHFFTIDGYNSQFRTLR
jgi:hypothetical protein